VQVSWSRDYAPKPIASQPLRGRAARPLGIGRCRVRLTGAKSRRDDREGVIQFHHAVSDAIGRLAERSTPIATKIYRADASGSICDQKNPNQLEGLGRAGLWRSAGSVGKTQVTGFTTDPEARGAPTGFTIRARKVRLSAGAGFGRRHLRRES